MRNFWTFRLRTLLLIVTVVALPLGVWVRARRFRELAAAHHFQAMDEGYTAAAIQRPIDPNWEWKFRSPILMDRKRIEEATPHWRKSIEHARIRDVYLAAADRPWLPHLLPAASDELMAPDNDSALAPWWRKHIRPYIKENPCMIADGMGYKAHDIRNMQLTVRLLSRDQYMLLARRFSNRRGLPDWTRKLDLDSSPAR